MKTLFKLAIATVILCAAFAAQAEWVSGYSHANVTYVNGYPRTSCDGSPSNNPDYSPQTMPRFSRTYAAATDSSPSYIPIYVSGQSGATTIVGGSTQVGDTTVHNYSSSDTGYVSSATITIGNSSLTALTRW